MVTETNCCHSGGISISLHRSSFLVSIMKAFILFWEVLCFLHFRFPTVHNTERYISMTKVCFFGRTDRRLLLVNTSILRRNKSSVNTNSVFSYFWRKLKKFLQCDFACKKISKNWKKHVFADFFKKFYPLQIARLTQVEIGFPKKQCFAFLDRDQRFK